MTIDIGVYLLQFLWELESLPAFERMSEAEKKEWRFHFFMEKAIEGLKSRLREMVRNDPQS